jgi:hypothetical protein
MALPAPIEKAPFYEKHTDLADFLKQKISPSDLTLLNNMLREQGLHGNEKTAENINVALNERDIRINIKPENEAIHLANVTDGDDRVFFTKAINSALK